jgi:protein TonB
MPRDLFTTTSSRRSPVRSTRLLPVSLTVHAAIVVAVIVVPLFALPQLPSVRANPTDAFIVEATLPRIDPIPVVPAATPRATTGDTSFTDPEPLSSRPPVSLDDPPSTEGAPDWVPGSHTGSDFGFDLPPSGAGTRRSQLAGPPAAPKDPIPISSGVRRPRKIKDVQPIYPAIARQAGVQGTVVIDAIIGPDGRVREAQVRVSVPLLDRAALEAVKQWEFTPTLLNRVPVAVVMTVEVRFRLAR